MTPVHYIRHYHNADAAPDTPLFYTVIHGKMNHMSERNIERIVKNMPFHPSNS